MLRLCASRSHASMAMGAGTLPSLGNAGRRKIGLTTGKTRSARTRFLLQMRNAPVHRAGLDEPWPRLFHNLRASRETELAADFPLHVVTAWLGNTPKIALKHYLMVAESDFAKAVAGAAQNPAQYVQEMACKARNQETQNPGFSGVCEPLRYCTSVKAERTGFEPADQFPGHRFSKPAL